jgi:hypothetical protein
LTGTSVTSTTAAIAVIAAPSAVRLSPLGASIIMPIRERDEFPWASFEPAPLESYKRDERLTLCRSERCRVDAQRFQHAQLRYPEEKTTLARMHWHRIRRQAELDAEREARR